MPSFYRTINPVDSSGKTRRTVKETMYDLYNLGEDVKNQEGGRLVNPWDAQATAMFGPQYARNQRAQLNERLAEEQVRMALVDELEKAKKSRDKSRVLEAVEKLKLYLEQNELHAAERKKGLMPRSIQATNEEKPFDALARIEASRFQEGSSGLLPGPGYGPYQAGNVDLSAADEFYRRKRERNRPSY